MFDRFGARKWQICCSSQYTFRKSHSQPECTLQLVCEYRVLFVSFHLHVPLCRQQHSKCDRAIRLVYPHFFCKFRSSLSRRDKNITKLGQQIQTAVSRWPFRIRHVFIWTFLSQSPILWRPRTLTFLLNHPVYSPHWTALHPSLLTGFNMEFWSIIKDTIQSYIADCLVIFELVLSYYYASLSEWPWRCFSLSFCWNIYLYILIRSSLSNVAVTLSHNVHRVNPLTPKFFTLAQCHHAGIFYWGFKFLMLTLRKNLSHRVFFQI